MLSEKARALLEQQRRKYLDSLPRKKATLDSCWRQVRLSRWEAPAVEQLKTEIHRLSGSAGSYGLDALGAQAMQLDRLLSADDETTAHREVISEQVRQLLRMFDKFADPQH